MSAVALAALLGVAPAAEAAPWPLWEAYAAHFINADGRVVDPQGGDRTTSEGQAYGMFFALAANDRQRFDALLAWTRDNMAGGDLATHLPGWLWGKAPDGQWRLLDANAASDADLWISYSLLEAGRLWNTPGYAALGTALARQIAAREVANLPGLGTMLLPGPNGFHPDAESWVLNPSYLPLPVVRGMAARDANGPWSGIAAALPLFLARSARQGFAMDWVTYNAKAGFAPSAGPGGGTTGSGAGDAVGSYDAIRVYLWAGMAPATMTGGKAVLAAVSGMGASLTANPAPPEKISAGGQGRGTGPVGFSAALLPYLKARGEARQLAKQQARLAAALDTKNGLHSRGNGGQPVYFDENLVMFGEGWSQERFRFSSEGELRVPWKKA